MVHSFIMSQSDSYHILGEDLRASILHRSGCGAVEAARQRRLCHRDRLCSWAPPHGAAGAAGRMAPFHEAPLEPPWEPSPGAGGRGARSVRKRHALNTNINARASAAVRHTGALCRRQRQC